MASGQASRASSPAAFSRHIGAQTAQHASWISRRADRIQRAAAWDGNLGNVSPALMDRFSQRVADRVQHSARAHQINAFAGGDNLEDGMDMPLVTNEGQITPLSEGGSDETPFEFGSFSPENVQRKPAALQAEAPAAPPMSNAVRERAEQLRRSMATNTPAPAIQPSRMPGISLPSSAANPAGAPAPRVTMQRAKPVSRVEEIGKGSAPRPAAPMPPMPEPPNAAVQRSAPSPSPRPASPSVPVPTVQRAAIPPSVVQGQGHLTQMLNARFKPKLDTARNPDAAGDAGTLGDDFSGDNDAGTPGSNMTMPRISRSVQTPARSDFPGINDDLTPRAPVQRSPAPDAGDVSSPHLPDAPARPVSSPAPTDAPVPTPKARVLRKPVMPNVATPPSAPLKPPTSPPSASTPVVQRKRDASAPAQGDLNDASEVSAETPAIDAPSTLPQLQRSAGDDLPAMPAQRVGATDASAPLPPAIQRETRFDADSTDVMPVVAPAAKADAPAADISDAPAIQRSSPDQAILPTATLPPAPGVQRSPVPESPVASMPEGDEVASAPAEMILHAPSAPTDAEAVAPVVQRSLAPDAPASAATQDASSVTSSADAGNAPVGAMQRSAASSTTESGQPLAPTHVSVVTPEADLPEMILRAPAALPIDGTAVEAAAPAWEAPKVQRSPAQVPNVQPGEQGKHAEVTVGSPEAAPAIQRMSVNPVANAEAGAPDLPDVSDEMPLVQRTPADDTDGQDESGNSASTAPAIQRAQSPSPKSLAQQQPPATSSMPAVQRKAEPAQASLSSQAGQSTPDVLQHAPNEPQALRVDASGDLTLRAPASRVAEEVVTGLDEAPSTPAEPRVVQRATRVGSEAGMPAALPVPKVGVPRKAAQQSDAPATPSIQRSNAEMVLRSPDVAVSNATDEAGELVDAATPAWAGQSAPFVQRALLDDLKPAKQRAGVGSVDMPVLRAVTRDAGESAMPEARTLSMPIVQRAAVKQERQAAQAAQTRPENPFVALQERADRMPVVQRAPAVEAPDVQRASDTEMSAAKSGGSSAPTPTAAAPAADRAITDAELTRAAQRLLPIIKRMLAVERERQFGR